MTTTAEYLTQLQTDMQTLKTNVSNKGVPVDNNDNFTTLSAKVASIPTGPSTIAPDFVSFYYCDLEELDLSWLDTSNIENMQYMFSNCSSLTGLDLSNFNTEKVTSMMRMFATCPALEELDLSSFDTSSVETMANMFSGCSSLETLDISSFDFSSVGAMSNFLQNTTSLTSINMANKTFSAVTTFENFARQSGLQTINMSGCTFGSLDQTTSFKQMFWYCGALATLNLSSSTFVNPSSFAQMFDGCTSLTSVDLSGIGTLPQIPINSMFNSCTSLMHIDFRNADFSAVTQSSYMFGSSNSNYVPANCEIIVKDDTQKAWFNNKFSRMTNVKTLAEYQA